MAAIELTASQTRELQGMKDAIDALTENLRRAETAGLDVTELQRRLMDANVKRVGMLEQFTPGLTGRRAR